jgi:hypothetical protein
MQMRGGTTSENLLFTGAQREVTVDTDNNTLRVHDGVTAGGFALATHDEVADGTFYYNDDVPGGSVANSYILVPKPNTIAPNTYEDGVLFGFVTGNPNTGPASASFQGLGVKSIKLAGGSDPAPGQVSGRVNLVYDSGNDWLELQPKPTGNLPQIRTVGATVSGNALTVTLGPCFIDFRSPSIGSGSVLPRVVTSQISLTIPAGATLGTISGVQSQIAIIAIDNGGTVELAAINLASVSTLNESSLISTTTISAAATSANTFYSSSARLNVPYRVVGMVESTQAAAGTWTNTPSRIQGQGGQAQFGNSPRTFSATAQSATSGTAIDFTGIPQGARRITLMVSGVSTTGTSVIQAQIGSGSVLTSGYSATRTDTAAPSSIGVEATTVGFPIYRPAASSDTSSGQMIFSKLSDNVWTVLGGFSGSNGRATACYGGVSLGGQLDRLRLTTVNGTDTFDAGTVNIIWEF